MSVPKSLYILIIILVFITVGSFSHADYQSRFSLYLFIVSISLVLMAVSGIFGNLKNTIGHSVTSIITYRKYSAEENYEKIMKYTLILSLFVVILFLLFDLI